jgi:cytochrome c-type biogenesis protein CcmH/NrfG
MARGAAQAGRKRPTQEQPKRKRAAPAYEQTMFFPRLRRQAKWVFVLLALVFAVGFVAFGVGSGSTGISDILRGNFFGGSSTSTSSQVKAKQKAIAANPRDINAYLDLAGIYQQDQDDANALATLRKAQKVDPKNFDVLNRIAGIYSGRAELERQNAQNTQVAYFENTVSPPGLDPSTTLGQAITADPYSDVLKTRANEAYQKMVNAFTKTESAYQDLATAAAGTSQEANAQLQLAGAAQISGDVSTAIGAYTRFLRIAPDNPNAQAVRQTLAQLKASVPQSRG